MAVIKCKMCGGDLNIIEGASTAECEFCGSVQTIPKVDDEKKLTLFARANRLRAACEFDKAAGIYEAIVADFPEEAEAYWGLVLCKYGIEYVDDAGTGRKIPTCHRSSYDSVMDDSNFDQAMENADLVAQKVYREEAKQIERIRKGILEVSSQEQPYDIFICYKETAPNGDRTLDSVLAQDLYSALTDKGYRVFFSRITLQGKLGEAYEPYIFAALNSAKVMLAVGTCYEYYNAVWVKNEWSRYLKICEADKSKHLIPCYKNLEPEDMPKEFNHLQGADLGKMGAVQDILFNMEKYIPLKKQTATVIQEKVVVGGSGNNKIASLLDRGNMALEDGDWAKADSFFEDVLNNDSKNAQAYLGKTLATEKCRTIDAFVRKRKDASQNVRMEKKNIPANGAHVVDAAMQYSITGYVEDQTIRKLYDFDLSYVSEVSGRREQYKAEENYWASHKWMSKAEKFADGAVAEHLQREKNALFAALSDRIKQAENAEAAARKNVQNRYDAHLQQADQKAKELHQNGLNRRENHYQALLQSAKTSANVTKLMETAEKFDTLNGYQDSKNLAEHCRKRAAEEQTKLDAEAARQRILKEKQERERKAKNKKIAIISGVVAVVVIAVIVVMNTVVIPKQKYEQAETCLASGDYETAITLFEEAGVYSDASTRHAETVIDCAARQLAIGQLESTKSLYQRIGLSNLLDKDGLRQDVMKDVPVEMRILLAKSYYAAGLNEEALIALNGLDENEEAGNLLENVHAELERIEQEALAAAYQEAEQLLEAGNFDGAISLYETLGSYQDSVQRLATARKEKEECIYNQLLAEAQSHVDSGAYESALEIFSALTERGLGENRRKEFENAVRDIIYQEAAALYSDKQFEQSLHVFELITGFKDTDEQIKACYNALIKYAEIGDMVTFGQYKGKSIQWTVLDKNGSKIMLFATKSVANKPYGANANVNWITGTIRKWLNEDFYEAAFTEEEKSLIARTTINNPNDPETNNGGCGNTTELVYLLSWQEADKYCKEPGFASGEFLTRTAGGPKFYYGTLVLWRSYQYVYHLRPDSAEPIRPVVWIDTDKI